MPHNFEENLDALIDRVGVVRRWLVAMAILRVAAFCVLFVIVYIVGYSLLDHHFNFGVLGRILGLVFLIGGIGILIYGLVRFLLVHISYSGAANYIEERNSFDQQLVAAVEYYENRDDYPYSKKLARQLVMHVCRVSQGLRFDATIDKWRGLALGVVTIVGLGILCAFVGWNLAYIRPYLARLAMPTAKIEPVTSTTLTPITGDIVASTDSQVEFAALIEGRTPESGKLMLEQIEPVIDDANEVQVAQEIAVEPNVGLDEKPRLETAKFFSDKGQYKYQFKAGAASTQWQSLKICDPPEVKSVSAEITLPGNANPNGSLEPYLEDVNDNVIELIANSEVKIKIEASCPVSKIGLTGLLGEDLTGKRDSESSFTFEFKADRSGALGLKLVSEDGLPNKEPVDIQVALRTDEPPEFELVSPEGDYLATNVSSVPIVFEVKDDFGLASAELRVEIPSREPMVVKTELTQGISNCTCEFDLELEDYNLNVGDSILFYARASDVDTGIVARDRNSSSDIYFIEIRPYQQFLHPKTGGGKGNGGGAAEDLLTILEYTRAAIKKTWAIASKTSTTSEDFSKLDSIGDDIEYCSTQLTDIRDDPDNGFTDQQKEILNSVLGYFGQAQASLHAHNAESALDAEKNAYTILRKFVDEMNIEMSPPPQGSGEQPKTPDKVKLKEASPFTGYEKERIEEELKKIEQKIDKLQHDQKNVKTDFENFLKEQAKAKASQQSDKADSITTEKDSKSGKSSSSQDSQAKKDSSQGGQQGTQSDSEKQSSDSQSSGGQGQSDKQSSESQKSNSSGGQGQSQGQSSEQTSEGQKSDSSGGQGQGQSQGKQGQAQSESQGQAGSQSQQGGQGQNKSEGQDSNSSDSQTDGQSSGKKGQGESDSNAQGSASSEQSGKADSSQTGKNQSNAGKQSKTYGQSQGQQDSDYADPAATEARMRMFQAKQRQLQQAAENLKEQLQQMQKMPTQQALDASQQTQDHIEKAISKMEQFQDKLDRARYEPADDNAKATEAVELLDSAEDQLAQAKDALSEGTQKSPEQQLAEKAQKMAEQLAEDADSLDKSLSPVEQQEMQARLEAAKELLKKMAPAQWSQMQKGGGSGGGSNVYTMDSYASKAETARAISRQFWSIALNAKKGKQKVISDEPSDIKFREAEIEFFKNAAKYDLERSNK